MKRFLRALDEAGVDTLVKCRKASAFAGGESKQVTVGQMRRIGQDSNEMIVIEANVVLPKLVTGSCEKTFQKSPRFLRRTWAIGIFRISENSQKGIFC